MSLQIRLCVFFPHQIATVIIRSCMHYSASWSMARDTDKIAHIIIPLLSSLALHSKELKLREMAPDSVSEKFPFFETIWKQMSCAHAWLTLEKALSFHHVKAMRDVSSIQNTVASDSWHSNFSSPSELKMLDKYYKQVTFCWDLIFFQPSFLSHSCWVEFECLDKLLAKSDNNPTIILRMTHG